MDAFLPHSPFQRTMSSRPLAILLLLITLLPNPLTCQLVRVGGPAHSLVARDLVQGWALTETVCPQGTGVCGRASCCPVDSFCDTTDSSNSNFCCPTGTSRCLCPKKRANEADESLRGTLRVQRHPRREQLRRRHVGQVDDAARSDMLHARGDRGAARGGGDVRELRARRDECAGGSDG